MQKDRVILVHGVGEGGWYDHALISLSPHFDCIPIGYNHYKRLGKLKVAFDLPLLLIGLTCVSLAVVLAYWSVLISMFLASLAILFLAGANVRAKYTRVKLALGQFHDDLYAATGGTKAHILAHSFGTFLTGLVVQELNHCFSKIVLAGSILPRDYEWARYRDRGPDADPKFQTVRNDVGSRDILGLLIVVFRPLMPDLGDSGRRGFQTSESVHTIDGASASCTSCSTNKQGIVHNVLTGFLHGTAVTKANIEMCWLPFLWEIPSNEYADALNQSEQLVKLKRTSSPAFQKQGEGFCERLWTWTSVGGRRATLISFLRVQIRARLRDNEFGFHIDRTSIDERIEQLAQLAAKRTWHLIAGARKARTTGTHPERVKNINPHLAAMTAAKWAVTRDRESRQQW